MLDLPKLEVAEKSRTYLFADGVKVGDADEDNFLARESGTHRLATADGKLHIVQPTWLHIEIDAEGFSV